MKKNILSIFSLCALMGLSGCNAFLELEPLDKVSVSYTHLTLPTILLV